MSKLNLPPQAYTKNEISQAYRWLEQQPEEIREQASNVEQLIALFRKAVHFGHESALKTKKEEVSTESFRSELKELANQLGEFSSSHGENKYSSRVSYDSSKLPPWANTAVNYVQQAEYPRPNNNRLPKTETLVFPQASLHKQNPAKTLAQNESSFPFHSHSMPDWEDIDVASPLQNVPVPVSKPMPMGNLNPAYNFELDMNSRAMVTEIKRKLNLSSDNEAIRMMISIGYEKLKNLF